MKHILALAALVFTTSCFGQETCPAPIDVNSNGAVDIADFLNVLGLFGDVDADGDGVWDSQDLCVDSNACNFQANQTEHCQYLDAVGVCGGGCESDDDSDGVCDFLECGDPKTYQGYHYATVLIGDQCWFAENLRSSFYQNGDSIGNTWGLTSGAISTYGIDCFGGVCQDHTPQNIACDSAFSVFGRLYNQFAVLDSRALCPMGWSVPTASEFDELTEFLGGWEVAGDMVRSSEYWNTGYGGNGENVSGFSALPAGVKHNSGSCLEAGLGTHFWTTSTGSSSDFVLTAGVSAFYANHSSKDHGFSVRCIQDSE